MARTVKDIIKDALKLINVYQAGDTPDAETVDDCFNALNRILESWNNQRLMLYSVKNVTGNLTANKIPHTVGTGGNINIDRPIKIESAFVRVASLTNPIDYQLTQDDNNRYQEYPVKLTSVSYPSNFYYEPTYPLASIYLYPVQGQALELHMSVYMQLTAFATLTEDVALPMGYEAALIYQLAMDIAPMYSRSERIAEGTPIQKRCTQLIKEIKAINQPKLACTIDSALLGDRQGSGAFNIYRGF